jgi:hypothetical protein
MLAVFDYFIQGNYQKIKCISELIEAVKKNKITKHKKSNLSNNILLEYGELIIMIEKHNISLFYRLIETINIKPYDFMCPLFAFYQLYLLRLIKRKYK